MALTVTTKLNDLKVLFNSVKEVYYSSKEIKSADLKTALTVDMELPVLEDISFDTGNPDVTKIKITTGANWVTKAVKADSDISFQVASIAGKVNELFMNKVKSADVSAATAGALVEGVTYKGAGYSLAPKKVSGALVMMSEDKQAIIVVPNVEMYASLVVAEGENPAYFNVTVTPMENSEGADIIILEKQVA